MTHPSEEPTIEDYRAWDDAMRQDFVEMAEWHMAVAGQQFPPSLVASMLLELGVRLSMTVQDPKKGAKQARQLVKATIAICEAELQGGAAH